MKNSGKDREKIRVLFVEDEFLIAEWVTGCLCDQGFAVQTASNARDALRWIAAAPVDILVTDINLVGGMDGVALARRARELAPDLPVIYASARVAPLSPTERVPGSSFLRKPYEPEAVARLIAKTVQAARAPAFA